MTESIEQMIRKRDQAYEMAGLAAQESDGADCTKWTKEAKEWEQKIREV